MQTAPPSPALNVELRSSSSPPPIVADMSLSQVLEQLHEPPWTSTAEREAASSNRTPRRRRSVLDGCARGAAPGRLQHVNRTAPAVSVSAARSGHRSEEREAGFKGLHSREHSIGTKVQYSTVQDRRSDPRQAGWKTGEEAHGSSKGWTAQSRRSLAWSADNRKMEKTRACVRGPEPQD